ncbi:MAG TPA: hypothetical protein VMX15_00040 [Candidatus Heimdallarchaeota archaeon]|nr:hypothetical protein [Candidatus Heimdallarchaeota archaeon]
MDKRFRPKASRFGIRSHFIIYPGWGAGNENKDTTDRLAVPATRSAILGFTLFAEVVPIDSDGTYEVYFEKWDASAAALVTLTSSFNAETLVAKTVTPIPLISTLSDSQKIFDTGDLLYFHLVSDSAALETDPTMICFGAEFSVLE